MRYFSQFQKPYWSYLSNLKGPSKWKTSSIDQNDAWLLSKWGRNKRRQRSLLALVAKRRAKLCDSTRDRCPDYYCYFPSVFPTLTFLSALQASHASEIFPPLDKKSQPRKNISSLLTFFSNLRISHMMLLSTFRTHKVRLHWGKKYVFEIVE